ncbi:hypothetical protein KM043_006331 [Ampulex compressa]|nr:hypothetical protein KM043_006331 [Ampulex compressa]
MGPGRAPNCAAKLRLSGYPDVERPSCDDRVRRRLGGGRPRQDREEIAPGALLNFIPRPNAPFVSPRAALHCGRGSPRWTLVWGNRGERVSEDVAARFWRVLHLSKGSSRARCAMLALRFEFGKFRGRGAGGHDGSTVIAWNFR